VRGIREMGVPEMEAEGEEIIFPRRVPLSGGGAGAGALLPAPSFSAPGPPPDLARSGRQLPFLPGDPRFSGGAVRGGKAAQRVRGASAGAPLSRNFDGGGIE
jgi:hypothetical protein